MGVNHWLDLVPSAVECRARRDDTGDGLVNCQRDLLRQKIESALCEIEPNTANERTLVACLLAAIDGELL